MAYHLSYHPDVKKEDLPNIPRNVQDRIRKAIEERLLTDPDKYGEPLKRGLYGYRKLRVGDYRIIYKVEKKNILIFKIGHRKEVYRGGQLRIER
ncbi:MAG: addiction module antitoxin RelB [Candidatus Omnitrophica bacterium 4484_70.1]|nr:MAG: addiction module antitoxin RelB [Candidatus Omnitrophica bacterium 4484_70.1]